MLFSVFEKLLFYFYVLKNQNILTFPNIKDINVKNCQTVHSNHSGGKNIFYLCGFINH